MEIQRENAEQEWIAKYRAAVNEIPRTQPRLTKIRAALETAWRTAISHLGHTIDEQPQIAKSQSGRGSSKGSRCQLEKPAEHTLEIHERKTADDVQRTKSNKAAVAYQIPHAG